jgi:Fas apoptotic inhibitory molecule (FAIM1)
MQIPQSRFTEEGNEISFAVDDNPITIKSNFSGSKKKGMIYNLFLDDKLIETSEE